MKIAVVGSREFDDYKLLTKVLDDFIGDLEDIEIISGGASGADAWAERYAWDNEIELKIFPADWKNKGRGAGFIRNAEIWDECNIGIAFWDGKSKGTAHSFDLAKKRNKPCIIVNYITGEISEV